MNSCWDPRTSCVEGKHLRPIVRPCTRVWKFGKRRWNMEYLLAYACTHACMSRICGFPLPLPFSFPLPPPFIGPLFRFHWQHEYSYKQIYTNEVASLWHLPIGVSSSYLYSYVSVYVQSVCVRIKGPSLKNNSLIAN